MALYINSIKPYFGDSPAFNPNNAYNALYSKQNPTTSFFGDQSKQKTYELSDSQKTTISRLEEFVAANVKGPQADKLKANIAGLAQLMKTGNQVNTFPDTLSRLFGNNPNLSRSLPSGSLVNQLF